jgi:hypothetical protein
MLNFSAPRYVEDGEEIRKYFAAFHLLGNFPAAVVMILQISSLRGARFFPSCLC